MLRVEGRKGLDEFFEIDHVLDLLLVIRLMVVSENLAYALAQRIILYFGDSLEKVTHRYIAPLVAVQTYKPFVNTLDLLRGE